MGQEAQNIYLPGYKAMTASTPHLKPGWVIQVDFGFRSPPGHEQTGLRPALVIGIPSDIEEPRFPVFVVVPMTSFQNQEWAVKAPALYHKLNAGEGGLQRDSLALLDQIQVLDATRILNYIGELDKTKLSPIIQKIGKILRVKDHEKK